MAKAKVFAQSLRRLPGIRKIIWDGGPPLGGGYGTSIVYKGKTELQIPVAAEYCDPDFIPFYQLKLLAGRNLRPGDSLDEFVINQTLAERLGFQTPAAALGKFIYLFQSNKPQPIVGVVADFHEGSFKEAIQPAIIAHSPPAENCLSVLLASNGKGPASVNTTITAMQKMYRELYPNGELNYQFMDESLAWYYEDEQKTASLVRTSMTLAIFISCMGLFGLVLFTTERKAREIGIRKVLGATVANIVTMITKDFALLVLLALLIAAPIAWWFAHRWLQDFAYRVPVHGWLFLLAGAGAILIAMLTVGFQTIRAAMANPIKYLRSE